jgi:hypothetical protein
MSVGLTIKEARLVDKFILALISNNESKINKAWLRFKKEIKKSKPSSEIEEAKMDVLRQLSRLKKG